jgi:hypothetical protein
MKIDRQFISASSAGLYDRPPATPSTAEHGPDGHQIKMHTHERIYISTKVLVYMEVQPNKSKIKKY